MPTQRTETPRNERIHLQRPDAKLPVQQTTQTTHPLLFGGPEGIRDSHC